MNMVEYCKMCFKMARVLNSVFRTARKSSLYIQHASANLRRRYSSNATQTCTQLIPLEDDEETKKRKASWRRVKYGIAGFSATVGLLAAYLAYELGSPKKDGNGHIIDDEFSKLPMIRQFIRRFLKRVMYYQRMIREPSRDKLLPDPVTWPYIQPRYTLVLEITDVLFHADWTYNTGWRFKKRPGVAHLLEQVAAPMFEIVVFTSEQGLKAMPLINALDPEGFILYRLVRDSTHFVDGHHIKDLEYLNRDLSKVIIIDCDSEAVKFHSNNALILPQWNGNDDDDTLYDLAAFLQTIAAEGVEDVREVLEHYSQYQNPLGVFRDNQRILLEQMVEEDKKRMDDSPKVIPLSRQWTPDFLHPNKF